MSGSTKKKVDRLVMLNFETPVEVEEVTEDGRTEYRASALAFPSVRPETGFSETGALHLIEYGIKQFIKKLIRESKEARE